MPGETSTATIGEPDLARGPAAGLPLLALSRPAEALAQARAVLAGQPTSCDASLAHQAAGIVLRDTGDIRAGVGELRIALRLARRADSADRAADVLATLAAALVLAGRTAAGLAAFDQAIERSSGVLAGQVLYRRGAVLWTLGRYQPALTDLRRAIDVLRRADDRIWLARALNNRGLVHLAVGSPGRADADFTTAGRLFTETGQHFGAAHSVLNRGLSAFLLGDLPAALSFLDEAARRYRPLNVPTPALSIDRCAVLLAAGLTNDALAEADAAVRDIERAHGRSTKQAELLLTAANCALAAAQPQAALTAAQSARKLFRAQQSTWWAAHAAGAVVRAKYAAGQRSPSLAREAARTAAALAEVGSPSAAQAHLVAGRVALDLGHSPGEAAQHLATAARGRHHGPPLSRATGWLAEALRAEAAGDTRRLFAACRRGLGVLDEHRHTLGASELRAQATAHGSELATLAQRHAARAKRPRLLLAWSERWRATALAVPSVRPLADNELNADLTALRDVVKRLEQAPGHQRLERDRARLERAVRDRTLRARGAPGSVPATVPVAELLAALGDAKLVELADVDGQIHVLVCGDGRVRQFTAGAAADAAQAADFARFALRRLARSRPGDNAASAWAVLTSAGTRLQAALLGPAASALGDGPVIVIPPGRLHALPWSLLPALSARPVSVAPSARSWLAARTAVPPSRHHVVLARGPGLTTGGAEVPAVAELYDDVTLLDNGDATAEKVLYALDGAWLAHVAAHGSFRADSPLFSSLRLHDGPLTAYDFERLHRAPYRLILPACDSGVLAPTGADELLGLVASLLPLGTAGIVAAIVPVSDQAAVPVMVELHRQLHAGRTLAEAIHQVRTQASGDPVQEATALSLVALGAA